VYEQSLAREKVHYYPPSLSILWTIPNNLHQLNLHSLSLRSRTSKVPTDFSLTMAPTEMVQCHPPMSLSTNTPPDSPGRPYAITLNNEQAMEMANAVAAMKLVPTAQLSDFSSCPSPRDPPPSLVTETATAAPSSPTLCHTCSSSQVAREVARQVVEALNSLGTNQAPPSAAAAEVESKEPPAHLSKLGLQTSTLEFKTVDEL
jgi:hypothetical protein